MSIPNERRKIRPNIEATIKEFTKSFNHKGKLRYRGAFRTALYALGTTIGINFGRIYRYICIDNGLDDSKIGFSDIISIILKSILNIITILSERIIKTLEKLRIHQLNYLSWNMGY